MTPLIAALFGTAACAAGDAAEASVTVLPRVGAMPIMAAVYIKYDAAQFPGVDPSLYDADAETDTSHGDPHVHFRGLRRGSYYLYGVGADRESGQLVTGGTTVVLEYDDDALEVVLSLSAYGG